MRERVQPVGAAIFGAGVAVALARAVYVAQSSATTFWEWPGFLAVALLLMGLLLLLARLLGKSSTDNGPSIRQRQKGGMGSHNYQAGGDLTITQKDPGLKER